jgi:hypothetical protein
MNEIELPPLVVRTGKSEFRLRCHAAAWTAEYAGVIRMDRRHSADCPGLLMLSATGPDTAAKAVRATFFRAMSMPGSHWVSAMRPIRPSGWLGRGATASP